MPRNSPLKNRVKELRERLNIRQSELAREVNITRQTIIAIEKGRLNPSIVICLKLSKLLREPVDYIFYLEPGYDYEQEARENATRPKRGRKKRVVAPVPEEMAEEPEEMEEYGEDDCPFDPVVTEAADLSKRIESERDAAAAALEPIEEPADLADGEESEVEESALEAPEPVESARDDHQDANGRAEDDPHTGEEAKSGQAIWDFF